MDNLLDVARSDVLDPYSIVGAMFYGVVVFALPTIVAITIRRAAR